MTTRRLVDEAQAIKDLQRRVRDLEAKLSRTSGPATVTSLGNDEIAVGDPIDDYPRGVSIMRTTGTPGGWPETHGLVETIRTGSNDSRQTFTSMAGTSAPAFYVRRWIISSSAWTSWATL